MQALTLQNNSLTQMSVHMSRENLSYNQLGKEGFKRLSTSSLRKLSKDLELKTSKVSFNPGGIGISGDALLIGMWDERQGIYVTVKQDSGANKIMYRTITHMKDYTGGMNHWVDVVMTAADYESFVRCLVSLKNQESLQHDHAV